ncbi:hypothetical protein [Celeribacter sp.]|uniref:hypothetical protein n=1 Tax=Celeribacter sp. TaxID=1890673 RepID=UPI003A91221A
MGKKLTIHVGMGKTGTSALQKFLLKETGFLKRSGIHYLGRFLEHIDGFDGLIGPGEVNTPAALAVGLAELETFAAKSEASHFIWSNEVLAQARNAPDTSAVIGAYAKESTVFDEVEILLVFRRQDEWIESAYRQWGLKHKLHVGHSTKTPQEFVDESAHHLDYAAIYDLWSGAAPTTVHSYDDIRNVDGIVQYFCRYWGLRHPDRFDEYKLVHGSLGPSQANFVALYNRGHADKVRDYDMRRVMRIYNLPEMSPPDTAAMPLDVREAVLAAQQETNAKLAKALGRETLFHDRPVAKPQQYDNRIEDALTYLAVISREQAEEIQRLRHRLNALEKQIGKRDG